MDDCSVADSSQRQRADQARRRAHARLWCGRHGVVLTIVVWTVFVMAMLVLTAPGAGR